MSGGAGCSDGYIYSGGYGGEFLVTFDVSSGQILYLTVGNEGTDESSSDSLTVVGGWNGKCLSHNSSDFQIF